MSDTPPDAYADTGQGNPVAEKERRRLEDMRKYGESLEDTQRRTEFEREVDKMKQKQREVSYPEKVEKESIRLSEQGGGERLVGSKHDYWEEKEKLKHEDERVRGGMRGAFGKNNPPRKPEWRRALQATKKAAKMIGHAGVKTLYNTGQDVLALRPQELQSKVFVSHGTLYRESVNAVPGLIKTHNIHKREVLEGKKWKTVFETPVSTSAGTLRRAPSPEALYNETSFDTEFPETASPSFSTGFHSAPFTPYRGSTPVPQIARVSPSREIFAVPPKPQIVSPRPPRRTFTRGGNVYRPDGHTFIDMTDPLGADLLRYQMQTRPMKPFVSLGPFISLEGFGATASRRGFSPRQTSANNLGRQRRLLRQTDPFGLNIFKSFMRGGRR